MTWSTLHIFFFIYNSPRRVAYPNSIDAAASTLPPQASNSWIACARSAPRPINYSSARLYPLHRKHTVCTASAE